MSNVVEKFLKYVKKDTQSSENSTTFPSTDKQKNLAKILYQELKDMGLEEVFFDEEYCYVYAMIPATDGGKNKEVLGFISHMDTSPEMSGENVKPRIVQNYDGSDIILNNEKNIILGPDKFPELNEYVGKSLIVTDGTTLLGADDKAGIAEIMTMAETLMNHKEILHGKIAVAFTPDEEIGAGVDHFDLNKFGADYAYTVDGGGIGELEYENFNAAALEVTIYGINVHPGEAKDKMKNASLIAMEYQSMLPVEQRPECTQAYEGFFHLVHMSGEVEEATLSYLIRDHDREKFEEKKALSVTIADRLNEKYGNGTVQVTLKDSYYNMKEKIEPEYMFLIDRAKARMEELGITPKIQPIRGGTDGARLSFMGLPCPNICTGGHNYHGRYEYCCVESMEKIVELLIQLAKN